MVNLWPCYYKCLGMNIILYLGQTALQGLGLGPIYLIVVFSRVILWRPSFCLFRVGVLGESHVSPTFQHQFSWPNRQKPNIQNPCGEGEASLSVSSAFPSFTCFFKSLLSSMLGDRMRTLMQALALGARKSASASALKNMLRYVEILILPPRNSTA